MQCSICGKLLPSRHFSEPFADVCPECYHIRFWDLIVLEKEKHVIVDGHCYRVGVEPSKSQLERHANWFGFSGAEKVYETFDGEVHVSHNMWYNGEIPLTHRDQLPDNARWV